MLSLLRRHVEESRSRSTKQSREKARSRHRDLLLEQLEERLAFASHTWTGAVSNLWSNSGNWTGGSPAGDNNASLVFPPTALNKANQNDLANLKIAHINFSGNGYAVSGNSITLNIGGQIVASNATTNTFAPNIAFSSSTSPFPISGSGKLTLSGVISGNAGITKTGTGTLTLTRTNSFAGAVIVSQGILNIRNSGALGTPNSTLVQDGATLEIQGGITVTNESLDLGNLDSDGTGVAATFRNVSSTNSWTGPVSLNSSAVINVTGALLVSGVVEGTDGIEFEAGDLFTKTGPGTLEFSNSNTYTAFTEIAAGTLRIRNGSALGATIAGTRVATGSTLAIQEAFIGGGETVSVLVGNESLELNGTGVSGTGALRNLSGGNTWGGLVTLTTASTVAVNDGSLGLNGRVAGGGGLTKTGPGSLIYAGPEINTYTGATSVSGGSLIVNKILNDTPITVTNQAVLGGNGRTRSVTLQNATLSPGFAGSSTAILRTQGNVKLDATSNFDVTINGATAGTNFDQLLVTGNADLGGSNLRVTGNGGAVNGTFLILQATAGVTGTFNGLPNNTEFFLPNGAKMRINYTSTQVTLTHLDTAPAFANRQVTTPINEGAIATVTGHITEPDVQDVFFLEVNWGDGTPTQFYRFEPGTPRDIAITHLYTDDNPTGTSQDEYTIDLFWHDQHGLGNRGSLDVLVKNVAPEVFIGTDETIEQDKHFKRSGFLLDAGRDPCKVMVDFGDGSGLQAVKIQQGNRFDLRHHYRTPGKYHVSLLVTDDDGGLTKVVFDVTVLKKRK